jgi:hypothetical protein
MVHAYRNTTVLERFKARWVLLHYLYCLFNTINLRILPTRLCVVGFRMILHYLVGLCCADGPCFLWDRNWAIKYHLHTFRASTILSSSKCRVGSPLPSWKTNKSCFCGHQIIVFQVMHFLTKKPKFFDPYFTPLLSPFHLYSGILLL